MRKADLLANHVPYDDAVSRYRAFIAKIIDAQRVIKTAREKRDLAESVLLRLCAHWERFVDEHLVDCVNCDPSRLSQYLGVTIPKHPTRDLCEGLIFAGGYKDFKDTGALVGYAKKILPEESNPFLALSRTHRKRIDEVYAIRNYLSHYSKRSRRALHDVYKSEYDMKRFIEPGQFLLAYDGKRIWSYFDAFDGASVDLYNFWMDD